MQGNKRSRIAVVLMSVGSPQNQDEIAEYVNSIRKEHKVTRALVVGVLKDPSNAAMVVRAMRNPTREQMESLAEKYRQIGGRSPLLSITLKQAAGLRSRLWSRGLDAKVVVAMKRLHPSIKEALSSIEGTHRMHVIGIVMFPTYSSIYSDEYEEMFASAIRDSGIKSASVVKSWDKNSKFLSAWRESISKAYAPLRKRRTMVVFATHSMPKVFIDGGDPYIKNFESLARNLAVKLRIRNWTCAYYTGGHSAPVQEVTQCISRCKSNGYEHVLLVPLGYVADNFETLYGLGLMCDKAAKRFGIGITRMRPLNYSKKLVDALSDIVIERVRSMDK